VKTIQTYRASFRTYSVDNPPAYMATVTVDSGKPVAILEVDDNASMDDVADQWLALQSSKLPDAANDIDAWQLVIPYDQAGNGIYIEWPEALEADRLTTRGRDPEEGLYDNSGTIYVYRVTGFQAADTRELFTGKPQPTWPSFDLEWRGPDLSRAHAAASLLDRAADLLAR
jgi:hypothetical protein